MDHDFFIRVASLGTIKHIDETLAEFRLHDQSKTSGGSYQFAREHIKIRNRYGGQVFGPAGRDSIYLIITQPLRRIGWLRKLVQDIRKGLKASRQRMYPS
jgi:muramidase (phage lysozyme)